MVGAPRSEDTRPRKWLSEWTADPETDGFSRGGETVHIAPTAMRGHL